MTELLHLSALLPAAFGACCTVGGRRGSRVLSGFEGFAAVAMFVAMADVALNLGLVAPILWVVALVALALVGLPLGRVARAGGNASASLFNETAQVAANSPLPDRPARSSANAALRDSPTGPAAHASLLHSSLGLIVMAGLLALMAAGHTASVASHHSANGLLPTLVLGGAATFAGYSAWRSATLYRLPVRNLLGCLEAASMAASLALMVGALALRA
ncbi:hypothetical protein [Mycetocola zhujimingii]|uniref:DUF5134 domain-containing protein n=1 Tax=Mycetocola zhujimingii TaxID=2079792 RepID=A0A2U1TC19_9MICO|nr:hypothetical protein [Mycetocola zhujimingii]PWC06424.1 hypothetical protein DF223_12590 [Mycetocola zhujimingii]